MTRRNSRPVDASQADDAYGELVFDAFHDQLAGTPRYRRDDDHVTEAHVDAYFTDPESWSPTFRDRLDAFEGRLLDVGCGPGKHARYCQSNGATVLAIDRSPGAIAVAREWGVDHAAVMDMHDVAVLDGFDGAYALGKQLAVGDSLDALRATLDTLAAAVRPGGRLLADFDAPTRRGDGYLDDHRLDDGAAYRRFRVEYDGLVGPWVDLLMLPPETLRSAVQETPWELVEQVDAEASDSAYFAVFERTQFV